MKRFLLHFLLAFSLFNQSINFDYAIDHFAAQTGDFDDVDSIWELLIETLTGDSDLMSENDNDVGIPENTDGGKDNFSFQYYQEIINRLSVTITKKLIQVFLVSYNINICKGHQFIISPPPDYFY